MSPVKEKEMIIELSDISAIQVSVQSFRGKEYVDIRRMYSSSEDPEWKPTKKGVSIPIQDFKKVYKFLRKIKESM